VLSERLRSARPAKKEPPGHPASLPRRSPPPEVRRRRGRIAAGSGPHPFGGKAPRRMDRTRSVTDDLLVEHEERDLGGVRPAPSRWYPVLAPSGATRSPDYFGIDPDAADALSDVMRRRAAIVAYTSGHTHRHRVRWIDGTIPSIEVGCVKDFPGTWAEYRVYDDGILQVVHRMSTPEALAWSEQCRTLYSDFGVDYASYALGSLQDRCFAIPLR